MSLATAGVAHPVERHLAKVEVASSSLVTRSKKKSPAKRLGFSFSGERGSNNSIRQSCGLSGIAGWTAMQPYECQRHEAAKPRHPLQIKSPANRLGFFAAGEKRGSNDSIQQSGGRSGIAGWMAMGRRECPFVQTAPPQSRLITPCQLSQGGSRALRGRM